MRSITCIATIARDGTITVTTDDPDDFDGARDHIMSVMAAVAGDKPIAYADCIEPNAAEDIARRLAKMLLGEIV